MKQPLWEGVVLVLVAIVFAVALTFASVELPYVLSRGLELVFGDALFPPGVYSGPNEGASEVVIQQRFLRPIGYACLAVVLALIVLGLIAERRGLATAGALLFFLPVFGHFAVQMFFLAGLGVLRTIWLPLLDGAHRLTGDPEFWLFGLGDVALLPYKVIVSMGVWLHLDLRVVLPYVTMCLGLLLFILGVLAWFRARRLGLALARSSVYRVSRHPQYLGWIVWSYGLLLYLLRHGEGAHFQIGWGIPDSLPWLVSAMVVVGVALLEEIGMRRELGDEYAAYAAHTPFLLPLPAIVTKLVVLPMRLVLRKQRPETGAEVAAVVSLYLALSMLASWSLRALGPLGGTGLDLLMYAEAQPGGPVM